MKQPLVDRHNIVALIFGYLALALWFVLRFPQPVMWFNAALFFGAGVLFVALSYAIVFAVLGLSLLAAQRLTWWPSPLHTRRTHSKVPSPSWQIVLLSLLMLYIIFILLPAYWSGMSAFIGSDLSDSGIYLPNVPLYSAADGWWKVLYSIAVLTLIAIPFLIVPIAVAILIRIGLAWHDLSRRTKVIWLLISILTILGVAITIPLVDIFSAWLLD
jgi:hypothetical protein